MTQPVVKPEVEKLIGASLQLAGIRLDAAAKTTVSANLTTVLTLAATIEDIGYEAAPIFRA